MNATEVQFSGVRFPTLLHAQWALFFEDLFMPWQFRPETFTLGSGVRYAPDFWLPRHELWFQVGLDADFQEDFRRWQEFAAAADCEPCEAHNQFVPGMTCEIHETHSGRPLPEQWRAREVLYSAGGLPAPEHMDAEGPRWNRNNFESMLTAHDNWYQWTACPQCGYVGAEHAGRADRLACGHGDPIRDSNERSNAPQILAAYRLARQTVAAQFGGLCAECATPMAFGDLVGAGRPVGRRRWYHADCLLVSRRKRYQLHQSKTSAGSPPENPGELLAG
ncbi:hypothetical protein AB0G04_16280 [Actinoplanes sp. NPDC023801]|uniref:hypothetical protein n=1 Tax=Actinoplanes sp. NPDC023801 TaxID=3154595 RepID=UPI00340543F5